MSAILCGILSLPDSDAAFSNRILKIQSSDVCIFVWSWASRNQVSSFFETLSLPGSDGSIFLGVPELPRVRCMHFRTGP